MVYSVCVALFDEQMGPYAAIQDGSLSSSVASKVAFKAMVALGSLQKEYHASESILSIPENSIVMFFRYFSYEQIGRRGDIAPGTIIFITDLKNQLQIYQDAPKLSKVAKSFIGALQEVVKPQEQLQVSSIKEIFDKTLSPSILKSTFSHEEELIRELVDKPKSILLPSLSLWDQRGVDRVVRALLINKPIAIIASDRGIAQLQLANARIFCPHRSPTIVEWTTDFDKDAEIQCGPEKLSKDLPSDFVIVSEEKISGGKPSKFCYELFQETFQMNPEQAQQFIFTFMDDLLFEVGSLLSGLTDLMAVTKNDSAVQDSYQNIIKKFKSDRSKSELKLIENLMKQTSPLIIDQVKQRFLLGQTRAQAIQDAVVDKLGPVGKIVVRQAIKRKLNSRYHELSPEKVKELCTYIIDDLKDKEILDSNELMELWQKMIDQAEDYHSVLRKVFIFQ